MAKYIDAEALINELEAGGMPIYWSGISGILGDKDCIRDYIERAPAADVQEVKHGEWVHDEFDMLCCSACREELDCSDTTLYCPYCGAKMDGGTITDDERGT